MRSALDNFHHHVLIGRRKNILGKLYRARSHNDVTTMNGNIWIRDNNIEEIEGIGTTMIFMFCLIYHKSVPQ